MAKTCQKLKTTFFKGSNAKLINKLATRQELQQLPRLSSRTVTVRCVSHHLLVPVQVQLAHSVLSSVVVAYWWKWVTIYEQNNVRTSKRVPRFHKCTHFTSICWTCVLAMRYTYGNSMHKYVKQMGVFLKLNQHEFRQNGLLLGFIYTDLLVLLFNIKT